jgi:Asp-tRNA(Asn)/Glu-tRNA(Gln) amidotransferase A subunit family amidase
MPLGISLMANVLQDRGLLNLANTIDEHFQFNQVLVENVINK